jgi:hypothetical protein
MKTSLRTAFSSALEESKAYLAEIEPIFTRSEFATWSITHCGFSHELIQLFPEVMQDTDGAILAPEFDVVASARSIARLVGGSWSRTGDGSWEGDARLPSGRRLRVVLHRVEPLTKLEPILP